MNELVEKLEQVLKTYGGTKYKQIPLTTLKQDVTDIINSGNYNKALIGKEVSSILKAVSKAKTADSLVIAISEKMFELQGMGA